MDLVKSKKDLFIAIKNNNIDLINLTDVQLMCHYYQHGRHENRKI